MWLISHEGVDIWHFKLNIWCLDVIRNWDFKKGWENINQKYLKIYMQKNEVLHPYMVVSLNLLQFFLQHSSHSHSLFNYFKWKSNFYDANMTHIFLLCSGVYIIPILKHFYDFKCHFKCDRWGKLIECDKYYCFDIFISKQPPFFS